MTGKAQFWAVPAKDNLPALYVTEHNSEVYVIGEAGKRYLTILEEARLLKFQTDLKKMRLEQQPTCAPKEGVK